MNEYRNAALKAKRNNDIELAKKYIRISKVYINCFILIVKVTSLKIIVQLLFCQRYINFLTFNQSPIRGIRISNF
jgi:hypothetical protein